MREIQKTIISYILESHLSRRLVKFTVTNGLVGGNDRRVPGVASLPTVTVLLQHNLIPENTSTRKPASRILASVAYRNGMVWNGMVRQGFASVDSRDMGYYTHRLKGTVGTIALILPYYVASPLACNP